ncbi:MAG: YbhB/YbcL family Raf kinase inhibitor-like protein [Gemmatimonadetes bacterium]|nr:YbhB/YbcL family Raf kinase inhibitor-like protein [Gemmatimonadota bacterium]
MSNPSTCTRLATAAFIALTVISGDPADTSAQGRGGRGGIRNMTLTSPAFQDGGAIPEKFAQPGRDVSPALAWSGAPDSTVSFALIMHDIDAVSGDGTADVLHWMAWGIPGSMMSLPESLPQGPTIAMSAPVQVAGGPAGAAGGGGGRGGGGGGGIRQLSVSGPYYRGPAAPSTGPAHHYVFELYALDANINVQAGIASTVVTRDAVMDAMKTHIRGKAVLVGLYKRPAP